MKIKIVLISLCIIILSSLSLEAKNINPSLIEGMKSGETKRRISYIQNVSHPITLEQFQTIIQLFFNR